MFLARAGGGGASRAAAALRRGGGGGTPSCAVLGELSNNNLVEFHHKHAGPVRRQYSARTGTAPGFSLHALTQFNQLANQERLDT